MTIVARPREPVERGLEGLHALCLDGVAHRLQGRDRPLVEQPRDLHAGALGVDRANVLQRRFEPIELVTSEGPVPVRGGEPEGGMPRRDAGHHCRECGLESSLELPDACGRVAPVAGPGVTGGSAAGPASTRRGVRAPDDREADGQEQGEAEETGRADHPLTSGGDVTLLGGTRHNPPAGARNDHPGPVDIRRRSAGAQRGHLPTSLVPIRHGRAPEVAWRLARMDRGTGRDGGSDMPFEDHFSDAGEAYRRFRPGYPPELFGFLGSLVPAGGSVWECGAGSGQATEGLARAFTRLFVTDPSHSQLRLADPRLGWRVACTAEAAPLPARCVDLVVVAQALHWIAHGSFFAEV